ncbi:MAG: glycosyltransferase family 39 protein, partial [Chloroflexi bacterium]|nr:glycosyltransferase family 39 protein [Chloroflexota bacterium]
MKRWYSLGAVALLLFAAGIRLSGAAKDTRLHPDEALYSDLSRTMMVDGDFNLIYRTTDKTPLTFFFTGGSIALLGENELAVRLPGVFFSLIGLAGLYAIGKQLAGEQAGLLALALATVSPLEIRYAPSAFQDILMLAMLIIALWQITLQRWTTVGFFYGVAVMMKPTALWVLPVIVMMGGLYSHRRMVRFLPGFAVPIIAVILWDWGRPQSLFSTGASNNKPGRFVRSDEVWPRFEIWLEHIRAIFPAGDIMLAILIMVVIYAVYRN